MLFRSQSVTIASMLPAEQIRARLREHAREWRESKLSTAARAEGFVGWRLKERGDRFVLRISGSGRNAFVPHFAGAIRSTDAHSLIVGELRISWFSRVLMGGWLAGFAIAPFVALFQPTDSTDAGIAAKYIMALFLFCIAPAFIYLGFGMVSSGTKGPALAIRELLVDAAALHDDRSTLPVGASGV